MILDCEAITCLIDLHAVLDGVITTWIKLCSTPERGLLDLVITDEAIESLT